MVDVQAEVIGFRSGIDGSEQRAGLCGPAAVAPGGEPLPLLVELQPGSILDLERTLDTGRRHLELVGQPAVWLRPGGRGPGTVFQGYGEVDVLEAIDAAARATPSTPSGSASTAAPWAAPAPGTWPPTIPTASPRWRPSPATTTTASGAGREG